MKSLGPNAGLAGIALAVIAIVAVAATGKPAGPAIACDLLNHEEVTTTMGLEVEPGERNDQGAVAAGETPEGSYSSTCIWRVKADANVSDPTLPLEGKRFAILNVITYPKGSGAASRFLQGFRDAAEHHIIPTDPVDLTGLGDEALWWGDGTAVRVGDVSFGMSIFLQNGDKQSQRAMEEALARKIASRI